MMKNSRNKTWKEKLEKRVEPKLVEVPQKWAARIGSGRMLVPSPKLVDAAVNKIPAGKVATVNNIREFLANKYKADITCPLTTGIFLIIAANASEENRLNHQEQITPYWRVLKEGGMLNSKYPGGAQQQAKYLKKEGFKIKKGKDNETLFVKEYDKNLALLN
jgi:alkylated DNA nucleotide flippase Atl1